MIAYAAAPVSATSPVTIGSRLPRVGCFGDAVSVAFEFTG
jgi:hypothetical protein